jgi:hypothetical protein
VEDILEFNKRVVRCPGREVYALESLVMHRADLTALYDNVLGDDAHSTTLL